MSEWIDARIHKPKTSIVAIVANERAWMMPYMRARYLDREDIWILYDTRYDEYIVMDVTHYIEIPDFSGIAFKSPTFS